MREQISTGTDRYSVSPDKAAKRVSRYFENVKNISGDVETRALCKRATLCKVFDIHGRVSFCNN